MMIGVDIVFVWDKIMVKIFVEVYMEKQVQVLIDGVMVGFMFNDYYVVVFYYYDMGKDLDKVLEWIIIVIDVDSLCFWQVCCKVFILVDMGKKVDVIEVVKMLMKLVEQVGNDDYVCMNKVFIEEWSK